MCDTHHINAIIVTWYYRSIDYICATHRWFYPQQYLYSSNQQPLLFIVSCTQFIIYLCIVPLWRCNKNRSETSCCYSCLPNTRQLKKSPFIRATISLFFVSCKSYDLSCSSEHAHITWCYFVGQIIVWRWQHLVSSIALE
jgi:hypothetical protein